MLPDMLRTSARRRACSLTFMAHCSKLAGLIPLRLTILNSERSRPLDSMPAVRLAELHTPLHHD